MIAQIDRKRGFVDTAIAVSDRTVLAISHGGYGEIRWVSLVEESGSFRH